MDPRFEKFQFDEGQLKMSKTMPLTIGHLNQLQVSSHLIPKN